MRFWAFSLFVQLELNRRGVAVLSVLDQEHHEERDDRRPGVDDQLPSVGIAEGRPTGGPQKNDEDRRDERVGAPALLRSHWAAREKRSDSDSRAAVSSSITNSP